MLAGRYRLVSRVGRGGMGTVWEAYDEGLKRRVAVKLIEAEPGSPDPRRHRFEREAWIGGRLAHPNIVRVFDAGEDGRDHFLRPVELGRERHTRFRSRGSERGGTMNPTARLNVSDSTPAAVCSKFSVRELALFGSAARREARPDSDIDLLVSFEEGMPVTLFTLLELQAELSALFARPVDLVPRDGLKAALRAEVLSEAQVLYAA